MKTWRFLLIPFSVLYGIAVVLRNMLYDAGIFRSAKFDIPVICVGNLTVGGTGKTPHIEYLIRLLQDNYRVATLSRGYKRETDSFIIAGESSTFTEIGDEPMQYLKKFKNIVVAVDSQRKRGINNLINEVKGLSVVLLDDAFQHRKVRAGMSILLTDYYSPYYNDYLLPAGRLREPVNQAKRADVIIVTKCPQVLSPITAKTIEEKIKPLPWQHLYFSYIKYDTLQPVEGGMSITSYDKIYTIMLVAGIANTYPLEEHLKRLCVELEVIKFPDHHKFSDEDIVMICKKFNNIVSKNRILVTTEKDLVRFEHHKMFGSLKELPFFYIPIKIEIHKNYKKQFDHKILDYVGKNQRNSSLHSIKNR